MYLTLQFRDRERKVLFLGHFLIRKEAGPKGATAKFPGIAIQLQRSELTWKLEYARPLSSPRNKKQLQYVNREKSRLIIEHRRVIHDGGYGGAMLMLHLCNIKHKRVSKQHLTVAQWGTDAFTHPKRERARDEIEVRWLTAEPVTCSKALFASP